MSDQGSSPSLGPTGTGAEMPETAECPTTGSTSPRHPHTRGKAVKHEAVTPNKKAAAVIVEFY